MLEQAVKKERRRKNNFFPSLWCVCVGIILQLEQISLSCSANGEHHIAVNLEDECEQRKTGKKISLKMLCCLRKRVHFFS